VAAGADPDKIALLDNFCWGDTRREASLGTLVEACRGCHDMAVAFAAPFVSGKDSLNNVFSYTDAAGTHHELSIPPTLLATAMGQVDDIHRAVTPDLKAAGNRLAIVGVSRDDLAGSQIELLCGLIGGSVPQVDPDACRRVWLAVAAAIRSRCIVSCHDVSDGGVAAAVAEMAIGGNCGGRLDLAAIPAEVTTTGVARDIALAFTETPGRFVCEVPAAAAERFEAFLDGLPWAWVGEVLAEPVLTITGTAGESIRLPVADLSQAWRRIASTHS
jgi:phosphoribosylformylglycinamidine (FGAM) synthase-like enzyme